jgi:AraC-like DNA-binding protein
MDYIGKIIQEMEQNIASISITRVDELRKPFKISASKFKRNFKLVTGSTPRNWLKRRKIELAHDYKLDDPALPRKEVVIKIGWDLSERQFGEVYKAHYGMTFGGKVINNDNVFPIGFESDRDAGMDVNFLWSPERKALEDIIFRMVLLSGEYSIKDPGELCRTVVSNIENTCFRFPFLTFEKEFIFSVFFDPDDSDHLGLSTVFTRVGTPDLCFVPNDKGIYLDLIHNVAINQEENVKKAILESITNWEEMTSAVEYVIIDGYQQRIYNKHIHPKINKDAGIFRDSKASYDSIIKEFREEYEVLLSNIHLSEVDLAKYIHALKEGDEHTIQYALGVLGGIGTVDLLPEKLDLLLQLAECPYMEHIKFEDYSFGLDKNLIAKVIEMCPRNFIPELVCDYFHAYRNVEDDGDYHGNDILSSILERHFPS